MGICESSAKEKNSKINECNDIIKNNSDFINAFINKVLFKYIYNNKSGIGYFCLIPFPDKKNLLPIIILNNLTMEKIHFIQGQKINLIRDKNEKSSEIKLHTDIKIYSNKKYNITFIEIPKNMSENYLQIDDDLMKDNLNEIYKNKNIDLYSYADLSRFIISSNI